MRRNKEQLHELININIFTTTIAIKQKSFNYNKYSLIYQGVQSQKSRSYKEQDTCSGVNSACKARIIVGFRQPRIIETYRDRDFYRRHLQDKKLYRNTVRSSAMQGMSQNPNHKIELRGCLHEPDLPGRDISRAEN